MQSATAVEKKSCFAHMVLLSGSSLKAEERCLLKFTTFMGVSVNTIVADTAMADPAAFLQRLRVWPEGPSCFAMSAETLCRMQRFATADTVHRWFEKHSGKLLVFGFNSSEEHSGVLSWITRGVVTGVTADDSKADTFRFPLDGREYSRVLAGLDFDLRESVHVPSFILVRQGRDTNVIMAANGRPVFIRTQFGATDIFLLNIPEFPDIDEKLSRGGGVEQRYERFLPLLLFVRHCFGAASWHGPEVNARLIIDDPLLDRTYGFLDYRHLFDSMRRHGYGVSVAFIPYNYMRTSERMAAELFRRQDSFSICVHGCDHVNREFADTDQASLHRKAALALERMELHQRRTKMAYEPVMVFPQGKFATGAAAALRASGYLAAVNSTCFPVNDGNNRLTLGDCLKPAVTRYHGMPIFPRRYPKRLVDCAVDVLLGRPVLMVEHHAYFHNGPGNFEALVEALHKICPDLLWAPLSTQVSRSCLRRTQSPGEMEVQFFTHKFQLTNTETCRQYVRLRKHDPEVSRVAAVLVGGRRAPFTAYEDCIEVEVEAEPGEVIDVQLIDRPWPLPPAGRPTITYGLGVMVRRRLSEFRDNVLGRHPLLARVARGAAKRLKLTGDS